MAFCVQCGESVSLQAKDCPACGRPVGLSTIGAALERQPGKGNVRLLKVMVAVAILSLVVFVAVTLWPTRVLPSSDEQRRAVEVALPSLVRVADGKGREEGGIVLRRLGDRLLVLTLSSAAPAGAQVTVKSGEHEAPGLVLLTGRVPAVERLSVVLVPERGNLAPAEARLATRPAPDLPLVAITPAGQPSGAGVVLSFDDGPESGSLVHDAPMGLADRGYGLWSPDGRLFALATFTPERGESLAMAVSSLRERLLVHEVPLLADGSWAEHALPIEKGTRVGLAARARKLELRLPGAPAKAARLDVGGWKALELEAGAPGPLQVRAERPEGTAVTVTLGAL